MSGYVGFHLSKYGKGTADSELHSKSNMPRTFWEGGGGGGGDESRGAATM